MGKVGVKDVMQSKALPLDVEQEYELYPGEFFKAKPPTFELIEQVDALGWKPKMLKGVPVRDDAGNLVIDDPRPYHQVVRERLEAIFGVELEPSKLMMPVAFRAHDDFLKFMRPIENGQD